MLKIAVCDDDRTICSELEDILKKIEPTSFVKLDIDVFLSGKELYHFIRDGQYFDIIFLDIEMELMNGIEVGRKLRDEISNETTQIIYMSSKENYAMQLFKVRPLDFIIKPLTYQNISEVFKIALRLIQKSNHYFAYQIGHTAYKVLIKDILYFESANREVHVITTDSIDTFYGKLVDVFNEVQQFKFVNIHKSYLVNYNHIIKLEYHQVTMSNKRILPISQNNRKRVRVLQLQLEMDDSYANTQHL